MCELSAYSGFICGPFLMPRAKVSCIGGPPILANKHPKKKQEQQKGTGTQPHAHILSHFGANLDAFTHTSSLKVGPHAKVDANITSDSDFQRGLLQ